MAHNRLSFWNWCQWDYYADTSFISAEQAQRNVEQEVGTRGFDAIANEANATSERALERVRIEG